MTDRGADVEVRVRLIASDVRAGRALVTEGGFRRSGCCVFSEGTGVVAGGGLFGRLRRSMIPRAS